MNTAPPGRWSFGRASARYAQGSRRYAPPSWPFDPGAVSVATRTLEAMTTTANPNGHTGSRAHTSVVRSGDEQ
ncbi:hypothetical protein [Nocardia paucivorans]|uniref:hypothetical protein n=1 Tax=Nocardia paucivorans TaxID=114259 RepID=UPI00030BA760|nr:hypothetical protein [Nocardia paucivorans]